MGTEMNAEMNAAGLMMYPVKGWDERDGFRLGDTVQCIDGNTSNGFSGLAVVCLLRDSFRPYLMSVWREDDTRGSGPGSSWLIGARGLILVSRPSTSENEEDTPMEDVEATETTPKPATFTTHKKTEEVDLATEFITRWNVMAEEDGNHLPEIEEDNQTVKDFLEQTTKKKQALSIILGLGTDLRLDVTLPTTDAELLSGNTTLERVSRIFTPWLREARFDVDTIEFTKNTIINPKGQQTKLTRALQQVVPDEYTLGEEHTGFQDRCRELAGARSGLNREACIAAIGAALKQKSQYTLSCNPTDFVTSSFGGGFTSCHGPNGVHFGGNLGLCLAENVLMAYVGTPEKKTGRMWIWISPDHTHVFQLKTYGVFPDHYRKKVREYIEHCLAPGRVWVHKINANVHVSGLGTTRGYFDSSSIDAAYIKERSDGAKREGTGFKGELDTIGGKPYCISCGDDDLVLRSGVCRDCEKDGGYRCHDCGGTVDEDDAISMNGDVYCRDCVSCCESCEEYFPNGDVYAVETRRHGTQYVCESCRDNDYHCCDNCGEWAEDASDVLVRGHERSWCHSCVENDSSFCEKCDQQVRSEDMDGEMCRSCAEEHSTCPECGDRNRAEDSCEHNGRHYCPDCVPDEEDEDEETEEVAI